MMPTLLELCGVDPGEHTFDGTSLVPLLYGEDAPWTDRIMVTDSQRVAYPIKWRKSATMSRSWRLINGTELYDIRADPEQRHDVAADYPEVVARLKEGYESWWAKVSAQFDTTVPITLGREAGAVERLTTHDWRNDPVACAWNQAQIRAGMRCNGYWEIDVAEPGRYRFELRRWPREEERGIAAGIPGPLKPFRAEIKEGWGGGRALPLVRAAIRVSGDCGDREASKPIEADDAGVVFHLDLKAGEGRLQTYLHDPGGNAIGAYYVYAERLG
jgi:arylsulfatase B